MSTFLPPCHPARSARNARILSSLQPCNRQVVPFYTATVVPFCSAVDTGAFAIVNTRRHEIGYLSGCLSLLQIPSVVEIAGFGVMPVLMRVRRGFVDPPNNWVFGPINRSPRTQWERTCSSDECTWQSQFSVVFCPRITASPNSATTPTEFGKGGFGPLI